MAEESIATQIVRALREGLRERLSLASSLGVPVAGVNEALHALQTRGGGCLELVQPYSGEPRLVVTVQDWRALRRSVADDTPMASTSPTTC